MYHHYRHHQQHHHHDNNNPTQIAKALTTWSGCSPSLYSILFESTMSSTTLDLLISFERNCDGAERFLPSLLPRWLYDTIDVGLIPALTCRVQQSHARTR